MERKRGRPESPDSKHERLYIRVEAAEKEEIMNFCAKTGMSLLQLVRLGMRQAEK